jgi:hypothetical protein
MSTDHDEPSAEIIELRPGQDADDDSRPIARKERTYAPCRHAAIRLDADVRRAYCRECDQEVPCFDYLMGLAGRWERFIAARREAERRMRVAQANLDELLRDERNAKARRRNWKKHEPEAARHLRAVMEWVTCYRPAQNPVTVAAMEFLQGEGEARVELGE